MQVFLEWWCAGSMIRFLESCVNAIFFWRNYVGSIIRFFTILFYYNIFLSGGVFVLFKAILLQYIFLEELCRKRGERSIYGEEVHAFGA